MCPGRDGAYCTLVEYPSGGAFELVPQLGIKAEFNDVRPLGGSPPLGWCLRQLVPLRSGALDAVGHARSKRDVGQPECPELAGRTQLFDTARDHVSWATGTSPLSTTWSIPTSTRIQTWSTTFGSSAPPGLSAGPALAVVDRGHQPPQERPHRDPRAEGPPRACDGGGLGVPILCRRTMTSLTSSASAATSTRWTPASGPLVGDGDIEWTFVGFYGHGRRAPPATRCIPGSAWSTTPARRTPRRHRCAARTIPCSSGWPPACFGIRHFADDARLDAELVTDCVDAYIAWSARVFRRSDVAYAFAWFAFWAALPGSRWSSSSSSGVLRPPRRAASLGQDALGCPRQPRGRL